MKKYEQLEQQVKEIQAEIERLKSMEQSQQSQTLHDLIVEWINDDHCSTADKLVEKIKSWLPEEIKDELNYDEWDAAWNCGYNFYRKQLLKKLK